MEVAGPVRGATVRYAGHEWQWCLGRRSSKVTGFKLPGRSLPLRSSSTDSGQLNVAHFQVSANVQQINHRIVSEGS